MISAPQIASFAIAIGVGGLAAFYLRKSHPVLALALLAGAGINAYGAYSLATRAPASS